MPGLLNHASCDDHVLGQLSHGPLALPCILTLLVLFRIATILVGNGWKLRQPVGLA